MPRSNTLYDRLLDGTKSHAVRGFSVDEAKSHTACGFLKAVEKGYAPRSLSEPEISDRPSRKSNALRSESGEWRPGCLHPNLQVLPTSEFELFTWLGILAS